MSLDRRRFLQSSLAATAALVLARGAGGAEPPPLRVGGRGGSYGGKLEDAKAAGLDGVELGVGGAADRLQIADADGRKRTKEQVAAAGLVVSSLSMDLMNNNPVATEPRAADWIAQCIEACHDFGGKGILVPFFGKAHLLQGREWKQAEVDAVVEKMKAAAPKAQDAGVQLGIECTLTAAQYTELLDRIGSEWVGCYYDIGNCTGAGFDVPGDIAKLGPRIVMSHFKDGGNFLGEGKVKLEPIAAAYKAIPYKGWIVLETGLPTKTPVADCARNVAAVRRVMGN